MSQITVLQKTELLRLARESARKALADCQYAASNVGTRPAIGCQFLAASRGSGGATQAGPPVRVPLLCQQWRIQIPRRTEQRQSSAPNGGLPAERVDGRFGGVFVTLWNGLRLRGCVGSVLPTEDICQTVREVTRASLMDPRFRNEPMTAEELPAIMFEISLLSDAVPMAGISDLICGMHGIIVRRGKRSGCFLPKVAAERGWSADEFLSHCCTMKAGLSAGAWREPGTQVLLFTAESFREQRRYEPSNLRERVGQDVLG